jgi:circadian clock protein KaiC
VRDFQPSVVVVDPISNLAHAGLRREVTAMLTRLIDAFKAQQITVLMTCITSRDEQMEHTDADISSLVDTWLLLRDIELGGERNRAMYVLKSRGMSHSNQIREFLLTESGIELADVYLGPEGVLTGSARQAQEAREKAAELAHQDQLEALQRDLERKREAMEAQITALRKSFEADAEEAVRVIGQAKARTDASKEERARMGVSRKADVGTGPARSRKLQEAN